MIAAAEANSVSLPVSGTSVEVSVRMSANRWESWVIKSVKRNTIASPACIAAKKSAFAGCVKSLHKSLPSWLKVAERKIVAVRRVTR